MTAAPEELSVHEEEGFLVCNLRPGRSRTADEAVGFVLLPVLVASTLAATTYVLVYLGIAVSGDRVHLQPLLYEMNSEMKVCMWHSSVRNYMKIKVFIHVAVVYKCCIVL